MPLRLGSNTYPRIFGILIRIHKRLVGLVYSKDNTVWTDYGCRYPHVRNYS